MVDTPQTQAPQWAPSQATPWLTQNVAARIWDAFSSRSIIDDRDLTAPPVSCDDGARYLIAATATGLWAGHDGQMAIAFGANASNGWTFCVVARHGNQLFIRDEGPGGTLIQYDGTAWNLAPEGVDLLDDLADVDFSAGVADGYTMLYDLSNSVWYAGPVPGGGSLDDLSDVSAAAPTDGYVLTFEQSSGLWVPMAPSGGGGASAFIDLTDVPASYSGKAGQGAFVKNDETGLEFLPITTGGAGYEAGTPTVPAVSTFTWANQGTSTATDGIAAIIFSPQINSVLRSLYKTAPSYPYDVYCRVQNTYLSTAAVTTSVNALGGILLRDSSDGEQISVAVQQLRQTGDEQNLWAITVNRWSSAGAFVSQNTLKYVTFNPNWLRVNVTSTTITVYISYDGTNWLQVTTESLATYIDNADQYGVCAFGEAGNTEQVTQVSYFSTTAPA